MCCLHMLSSLCLCGSCCLSGRCVREGDGTGDWEGMCSAGFCEGCEPVLLDLVPQGPWYQQLESGSSLGSCCSVQSSWKAEWAACLTQLAVSESPRLMGSRRFFLFVLVKKQGPGLWVLTCKVVYLDGTDTPWDFSPSSCLEYANIWHFW